MCRLFGMVSARPDVIKYWMLDSPHPLRGWSDYHAHGWGIGWYEHGTLKLVKEPVAAQNSALFAATAQSARSPLFVSHIRKATCGELTLANTHPFSSDKWLFAHNGMVDRKHLRQQMDKARAASLVGDTDSEVYFQFLLQQLERAGEGALPEAIAEVRRGDPKVITALNFLMSDGRTLYAYWEQMPHAKPPYPDYYQLWYTERVGHAESGKQVIVCSERLDDNDWNRLPPASLMEISPLLEIRVRPVP